MDFPRRRRPTQVDVQETGDVAFAGHSQEMHSLTALLGAGRLAIGSAFLAYPAESVRILGVDTASANRMVWLARMTAVRDAAIGLGVLGTAVTRRGRARALMLSALVDATDAVVLAVAAREKRVDRVRGYAAAAVGAAGALAGLAGAATLLRRRR
jgi:hypothetical protein